MRIGAASLAFATLCLAGCGGGAGQGPDPDMLSIPAGAFQMGCAQGDGDCLPYENPLHEVDLSAFHVDATEVTQAAWAACRADGACGEPTCVYDPDGQPDHPVVCVDHGQARDFCRWRGARLCTEAQWERAARGTQPAVYPWGDAPADCQRAVMAEGGDGCGQGGSAPVGGRPSGASPEGALDMAGNVSEWTADWFAADYYAASPAADPPGPEGGDNRVIRGGSFTSTARYLRCSYRAQADPAYGYHDLGLRCCR